MRHHEGDQGLQHLTSMERLKDGTRKREGYKTILSTCINNQCEGMKKMEKDLSQSCLLKGEEAIGIKLKH